MWHKPCRTFNPWCLCIKTRCLSTSFMLLTLNSLADELFVHKLVQANKKNQVLHYWPLCEGNPPVASGFPSQRFSNAGIVSISWPCLSVLGANGGQWAPVCQQLRWRRQIQIQPGIASSDQGIERLRNLLSPGSEFPLRSAKYWWYPES